MNVQLEGAGEHFVPPTPVPAIVLGVSQERGLVQGNHQGRGIHLPPDVVGQVTTAFLVDPRPLL